MISKVYYFTGKESITTEKIAIKKEVNYFSNKKETLKGSQELVRSYSLQAQAYKTKNLLLEKRTPQSLAQEGLPRKVFTQVSFHHAQPSAFIQRPL